MNTMTTKRYFARPATRFVFTRACGLAAALSLCVLVSACGGPQTGRVLGDGSVQYDDPTAVETVTADYGSTDLQMTAEYMTQQLLASPVISTAKAKPKIRLRDVINYTDEHIDTKGITDKIRVKLMNSGTVRFLADTANLDSVFEERELAEGQREPKTETVTSETGEKTTRVKKYKSSPLLDSDYIVTGAVRSIRKYTKKIADVYYQITMELVDPHTGEIVWVSEKEIRKTQEKPSFGW